MYQLQKYNSKAIVKRIIETNKRLAAEKRARRAKGRLAEEPVNTRKEWAW